MDIMSVVGGLIFNVLSCIFPSFRIITSPVIPQKCGIQKLCPRVRSKRPPALRCGTFSHLHVILSLPPFLFSQRLSQTSYRRSAVSRSPALSVRFKRPPAAMRSSPRTPMRDLLALARHSFTSTFPLFTTSALNLPFHSNANLAVSKKAE